MKLNASKSDEVFHLLKAICFIYRIDDVKTTSTVTETAKKKMHSHAGADAPKNASKAPSIHSCWSCNQPGESLLMCSACRKARYCGEPCQWEDWGRHGEWCRRKGKMKSKEKRNQRKSINTVAEMKPFEGDEVD